MMDQSMKAGTPIALCTLLLISLTFIYLLSGENPSVSITSMTRKLHHSKHSLAIHETSMYRDELETALEGASMANKTVIITIVNRAYTEGDKPMLDIFLDGFWLGENTRQLTNHLLIVAVDQTAFERCTFLRLHCYKLKTDGEDFVDEKTYMSEDFIKMMWQRTRFLGDVLRRGYNFVFTDTDVLWLRNPFPRLTLNETIDLQISVDQFNGNQWSQTNPINTGFYMIKSNNKTIALFDEWYGQRNNSTGKKEQDVLVELMQKSAFERLRLRVRFLDTIYFSGFCQDSRDANIVSTVHANCCRSIRAKVTDLVTVIHDWKRFKDPSRNKTIEYRWSNHLACQKSWIS
ncbi:putative nucleotide-diphospho-sugar transferase [Helianthus annuus]|uniref:Nucleotide-diphospho-sugar transferase n=1 Tax=Helianthus annuus TaxID=4232 RepID=A0A251UFC5_HELAN|nr:uncharacterized protein At1g28695 [Helianthus annuus]KAF5800299.1 putative nucleotide-diphospho-sugar transferase [Helianthus annuus]